MIHACVGGRLVGVRVAWDAEGVVTVGLQGELSGSAEERCVQEALRGLTVEDLGSDGSVVHPLR